MRSNAVRSLLELTSQRVGALVLAIGLVVSGCATLPSKQERGLQGHSEPSDLGRPSCERSVSGDTITAERHLERGRPELAKPYIEGLEDCLEAQASLRYLRAAMAVYVGIGALNASWVQWQKAHRRASHLEDAGALAELDEWSSRFRSTYTMLELPRGSTPPAVTYDGPFADAATLGQLDALREGHGFDLGNGRIGFWLLPGRYKILGSVEDLLPGMVFKGDERK